ncbi:glycosyltransferase family 2 protein [Adlercreutzia caecimuris]|jgi:glycosyltransferase involved in cell wall biosynthesis|uniref:glycosyltransferase family 2 protein n=1 Tax=Adlercreutzia caecimuris TaxID=671266 RepID=UPI002589838F|nr:glycosyltransferase family 2 protein [Adlercreutzia caecimuris]
MTRATFIVPCFNEQDNVYRFYNTFFSVFERSPFDWNLVFIDDGSSDDTWSELQRIAQTTDRITAISFSRNFGKEAAIWAGLNNASGDLVGIIDADLQQSPTDALAMCEILEKNPQYDCVAAFQERRRESGFMTKVKGSFYSLFAKLSGMNAIQDASDFRVFRKSVADAIRSLPESFRFSKGIFAWVGFNTYPYPYTPDNRAAGESKWSTVGLVKYALEGMLAFSVAPLRIATTLGLVAAACAIIYFVVLLGQTLIQGVDVPGYATLMGVMLLLGGAQLICMGIMGEYIARSYVQGKNRPIYIEKARIGSLDQE